MLDAIVDAVFFFTLGALVAIILYSVSICIKAFSQRSVRVDDDEENKELSGTINRYNLY